MYEGPCIKRKIYAVASYNFRAALTKDYVQYTAS